MPVSVILSKVFPVRQVEVQCLLLLEVLGGSHKHAVDGAVKKLTKLWKEVSGAGGRGEAAPSLCHRCHLTHRCLPPLQNPGLVEQYFSAILSLEPNQNYAGMLGLLVQFCTNHKEMDVVNQHKAGVQHGDCGFAASGGLEGRSENSLSHGLSCGSVNPGVDTGVIVHSSPLGSTHAPNTVQETVTLVKRSQRLLPS